MLKQTQWKKRPKAVFSKVGDSIVFAKYCGTQVKYNGEELLILAERDILAVVEPDKKKK